jgi:hypothetical protein
MNTPTTTKDQIYRWEGLIFNLLSALYFLFLAPLLQTSTIASIKGEPPTAVPWLGWLLILISILEVYAFPLKMCYVQAAVKNHQEKFGNGIFLWMFHAVISILLMFTAFQAFGFDFIGEEKELPWWMMGLIFATVIKELYFMGTMMGLKTEEQLQQKYGRPNRKEWLVDLILLVYACIAYTACWQSLSYGMDMEKDNMVMYIVNCFVAGLLFLIFYLPLRIPYHLEETAQLKTAWGWLKFIGPIVLIMVIVVLSL